jgi:(4-alkanoyl-5-oxo-2,5-dihydrofuran-3-yl)methyl phosphate reductase
MIVVTGATGQTGRPLIAELVRRGAAIRALVRDPAAARRMLGPDVELVRADLGRPDTLDAALKGAERVYLLAPPHPRLAAMEADLIDATRRAGVRQVVKHSAIDAGPTARSEIARMHFAGERLLAGSGLAHRILRGSMFMQNFLMPASAIVFQGRLAVPMGGGRCAFVDCADMAAVAAAVLTREGHDGHTYLVTGGQALSIDDVAAHLSAALGRPIRYVDVPVGAARAALRGRGVADWQVEQILGSAEAFAAGEVAQVTQVVARLTGRRPRTFAAFAHDLVAAA